MNGTWLRGIVAGLALISLSASAGDLEIVIVKSSDNSYFNQSIQTLISHLESTARIRVTSVDDLDPTEADSAPDRLYIGLGLPAASTVGRLSGDRLSFSAYLTREQYQALAPEMQVGVLLDQPLYRYLAFCKLLLAMDSVGIASEQPVDLGAVEKRMLAELGFALNQYRIDEDNKLLPVLRQLLQQNDALLMLPRAAIYNRDSLKGVLLTSYRFRKPAISYAPAHVEAGALASIYSSPEDIGRHLAELVNTHLRDPGSTAAGFDHARYYSIDINSRVARALDLELPGEREIRLRMEHIEP
jgi:putative ABC transport system substrate-binding protein